MNEAKYYYEVSNARLKFAVECYGYAVLPTLPDNHSVVDNFEQFSTFFIKVQMYTQLTYTEFSFYSQEFLSYTLVWNVGLGW